MRRLLAPIAAALLLAACQDPASPPSPGGSPEAGGVSFRLQSLEASVLGTTSDSIKVEAARSGYPTVAGTAALHGSVALEGLQAGVWTIRVAAFDSSHAIQWYGDTLADIRPGVRADVVVRLRRATGTAVVRIILDSAVGGIDSFPVDTGRILPVHDTLWPQPDTTRIGSGNYHLLGAGIVGGVLYLRTGYDCNNSPEIRTWVDTAGTLHYVLGTRKPSTKKGCITLAEDQIVAVKIPPTTRIVAQDLFGISMQFPPLVRERPLGEGWRFIALSYEQGGGFSPDAGSFAAQLDSMGRLVVIRSRMELPSTTRIVDTLVRVLTPLERDSALLLLNSDGIRHPGAIVRPPYACADAGWWKATLVYDYPPADGYVASYDKPEEICSELPQAYYDLGGLIGSLVDGMLNPTILIF